MIKTTPEQRALAAGCEGKRNKDLTPAELKARVAVAAERLQAHFDNPKVQAVIAEALAIPHDACKECRTVTEDGGAGCGLCYQRTGETRSHCEEHLNHD